MLVATICLALAFASPPLIAAGPADGYAFPVNVPAGSLAGALRDLARQTGVELLFDGKLVEGMRAVPVRGRMTVEGALRTLLAGTNLSARRSASGAWLIERSPAANASPSADLAEPEILVVGQRTQNVAIRRRENDVQPYQVATGEQIARAHRDNLDQYFRSRVTANTQAIPPSLTKNGDTNSEIDLRGFGSEQTLILVDGRRMPGAPLATYDFDQPDINAIPLHAIERVETLTGTAGGIYGFGALGGVVNIVLRRDYHGLELHGTTGISTRGDAGRLNLEGGLSFSPDGGRTDISVYVSQSWQQALREGDRDYMARGRTLAGRFVPQEVVSPYVTIHGNAITIINTDFQGGNLVLKPEYGGATLASGHTFLQRGFAGTPADMIALLTQHADQVDISPSEEMLASDLGSTPTTTSAIFNIRHRFGGGIEAYVEGLILRDRGRYDGVGATGSLELYPDSPLNPFENEIAITFPVLAPPSELRATLASDRYTAGLILPLFDGWKATAEATIGAVHSITATDHNQVFPYIFDEPDFNPFGTWTALQRDLATQLLVVDASSDSYNRYREESLRVAGPLFRTAAGETTLTLLSQNRNEKVPTFKQYLAVEPADPDTYYINERSSATRSLYAEIDAPLIAETAPIPLLKGLAFQLAVRRDDQAIHFSANPGDTFHANDLRAHFIGTTFTAGAKLLPFPWLMLRGSYATGQQPPELADLIGTVETDYSLFLVDPKRSNTFFGEDGMYLHKDYGSPDLKTLHATTLSLGMVINPLGNRAPRVSVDFSRIRRTGDVELLDSYTVLAHEDLWPDRVTRDPLTDADRALGYTAGRITLLDSSAINSKSLEIETIDGKFDWTVPLGNGTFHAYASATWQVRDVEKKLFQPAESRRGFITSPLTLRANIGAEWTIGRTLIGANLQYFGHYRISDFADESFLSITPEDYQGGSYVKAQTYLDLYASRRFRVNWSGKPSEFSVDLGIVNLLDAAPPYEEASSFLTSMYSFYGDPRRRRIELTLNASF